MQRSTFRKLAVCWLTLFTILCFANSTLVIVFEAYGKDKGLELAFVLPFAHSFAVVAGTVLYGFALYVFSGRNFGEEDWEYIRENHPSICDQLGEHAPSPTGRASRRDRIGFGVGIVAIISLFVVGQYYPYVFKYGIYGWVAIILLLPAAVLLVGTVHLAFLFLFKGKESVREHLANAKERRAKECKERTAKRRRRRLFRSKEDRRVWEAFLAGELDGGADNQLEKIRNSMKYEPRLIIWAIGLTPLIWIYNLALLIILHGVFLD